MFYFTYVLKSSVDENLYIGYCSDIKKRLVEHNSGLVTSTKDRRPFNLVYFEACRHKKRAIEREKYLKSGFGRRFLKSVV